MVIAIDGPAGSGKGTVTELLAKDLNFTKIDTGAMYRAITWEVIQKKVSLEDIEKIKEILCDSKIEFQKESVFLNQREITNEIRTKEVSNLVSQVSHIPEVRNAMVELQRKMGKNANVIMEGRDIGTNVFPNAEVKIYLDASPEERARRRYEQNLEKRISTTYEEVLENVKFRDYNDKTSNVGPLKIAEDAVIVDSTNLTIEEVVETIKKIVEKKVKKENAKC